MGERIKKLRKALNLTQQEFADKLGTARNNIAGYEIGRRLPSDAVITLICRTFNVSESWLRVGEGEIFYDKPDNVLDALVEKYALSYDARILVEEFINLKPDAQQVFIDYAHKIAKAFYEATDMPLPERDVPPMTVEEAEAEYIKSKSVSAQNTDLNASSSTAAEKSKLA